MTTNQTSHAAYRPDIDGLRAFAVLSVVVFHAFPSLLPGGFVGVDVFFVISGFLISGIMFKALQAGTFSFSDFYARRVNRIFPALILVLSATFGFAWFVLFNDELKQLGNHLSRAAAFLSNFILWHESGYFDNAAETKPLLHLWSLAIEEQFYIVWPLMVWALWRLKAWRLQIICALVVASFAWNIYQSQHDLTHDFYSPLTRFWELLCGALLAYRMSDSHAWRPSFDEAWLRTNNLRPWVGAVLLLAAVGFIDATQKFPGGWVLLPVLGAVLVISGDGQHWVNRVVLSQPQVVWIGTISYPLYLWHWPVFSFARIVEGGTPSAWARLVALFVSVVLAWLTFRCVEKPIRFTWRFRYKTWVLTCAMLCVGLMGYLAHKADGYPRRSVMENQQIFNQGDIGHDVFHQYFQDHFFPCAEDAIQQDSGHWKGVVRCFQSHKNSPVTLVLLGDSHAEHLFLGLAEKLPHVNVGFYVKGTLPFLSKKEFDLIFDKVLKSKDIKQVVISAMWANRMNEVQPGSSLAIELNQTIKALQASGKQVYLSDDIPQFEFDPQRCKFQRPLTQSTKCDESIHGYKEKRNKYGADLAQVYLDNEALEKIELSSLMCNDTSCSMARNGQVLYRDNNHLNIPGSQYVGAQIVAQHPSLGKFGAP
ncbi:COG1835 Predicted acyltransferases [Burkholderiaceae bacterium]